MAVAPAVFVATPGVIAGQSLPLLGGGVRSIGTAFIVVALMFPVAGVLWLAGARQLERDRESLT